MEAGPDRVKALLRELALRVLGSVVRRFRDFAACEDAVREALLAASTQWPREGVPEDPRAWLIRVAARRLTSSGAPMRQASNVGGASSVFNAVASESRSRLGMYSSRLIAASVASGGWRTSTNNEATSAASPARKRRSANTLSIT
jgi:hypothetical protein